MTATSLYDFPVPDGFWERQRAPKHPRADRSAIRLMVLHRKTGTIEHRSFSDFSSLAAPYEVWANDSALARRRARLWTTSAEELWAIFTVEQGENGREWEVRFRPEPDDLRAPKRGDVLVMDDGLEVRILDRSGHVWTALSELRPDFDRLGTAPLPDYVARPINEQDFGVYECVWARKSGSLTVPSAGMPITADILERLDFHTLTLHLGFEAYGAIESLEIEERPPSAEWYGISQTPSRRKPVLAIGTTTVRSLETWAVERVLSGWTELYITEGHRFLAVDALLTNFHLPEETLTVLASAFVGNRAMLLDAYRQALAIGYDFSDYGDSMLIVD